MTANAIQSVHPVLLEHLDGHVARITLNWPNARNAVNGDLANSLERAIRDTETDSEVRVVVLTGAGRGFCAGADLAEVAAGREAALWTESGGFAGFVKSIRRKPWLAAVHGFAFAGGLEIALSCDLIVASEDARFGLPEVKRGLVAAAGGLYRLPSTTASRRLVFGRLSWGIGGPRPAREARRWLPMTAVKRGLPPMLRRWSTSSATPTAPHPCATTARACSCRPRARA